MTPLEDKRIREKFKPKTWNEIKTNDSWAIFKIMGEFVNGFENHEEKSKKILNEFLVGKNFSSEKIEKIEKLIDATKIPQNPLNKLEEIDIKLHKEKDSEIKEILSDIVFALDLITEELQCSTKE